jgi:hypothetical protein
MRFMLVKQTNERKLRCIDCGESDPLDSLDTQGWFKGELGSGPRRASWIGNIMAVSCRPRITTAVGAAPLCSRASVAESYRHRALVCEQLSKDADDPDIEAAWGDIATEWYALSRGRDPEEFRTHCPL